MVPTYFGFEARSAFGESPPAGSARGPAALVEALGLSLFANGARRNVTAALFEVGD